MNSNKKEIINTKDIAKNGIRVDAKIKSFKKGYPNNAKGDIHETYCLIISYKDPSTNIEKEFTTPYVNFNPLTDLASKKCSVFINKDKVYATDFIVDPTTNNSNIWSNEELSEYNKQLKVEKKINIIFTPLTIIELLLVLIPIYYFIEEFILSK